MTLYLVPGVGRGLYHRLLAQFQSPGEVLDAPIPELKKVKGVSQELAERIVHAHENVDVEQEVRCMESHRVSLLMYNDQHTFLQYMYTMSTPPPLLYVKGNLVENDRFAVTVVGSRACTPYGKLMCERIVRGLVDYGLTIVSGAAAGIDTFAHTYALKNGGRSIAVLPSGLAAVRSSRTTRLVEEIASNGAVLSEFPMKQHEERKSYAQRNTILAGLSHGTVVVEAAPESGSCMTAYIALDENRSVYAVPGDVNRRTSKGCNELIKQGARLVESADDIIEDLRHILEREGAALNSGDKKVDDLTVKHLNGLTETERRLYDVILRSPISFEELISIFGADKIGELSNTVLHLEMKGFITQLPGKIYTIKN